MKLEEFVSGEVNLAFEEMGRRLAVSLSRWPLSISGCP